MSRTTGTGPQVVAADPNQSVWVSANAGTGKTRVLIDRISRLLLAGTPPGRILCLTFTKAAAAEMDNRLSDRLGHWSAMDDGDLNNALAAMLGRSPSGDEHAAARRLFAETIEAPEGLRIRTIHSFCESLLGRFPLEAGVSPHFSVIDERTAAELRVEARNRVLAGAFEAGSSGMRDALGHLAGLVDETGFGEAVDELDRGRGRLKELIAAQGGIDGLIAEGRRVMGIEPYDTRESILAAASAEGAFDRNGLSVAAEALATGSKTDKERGEILSAWLAAEAPERATFFTTTYRGLFLTQKNEARAAASVITKKLAEKLPDAQAALLTEQVRVVDVFERLKAVNVAEATQALLTIGHALLKAYEDLKSSRALMDYDDLIGKAQDLLRSDGGASWVHYKLDGGIDHILVDEAQDTSPEQWEVIASLAGDFFAGAGRREETQDDPRTVFAVGDEKQSIYSFQGADPARFDFMRARFAGQVAALGERLQEVELATSYRSTQAVLSAVDAVFGRDETADGLTWGDRPIRHTTARNGQGGLVELWPLTEPETATEADPWDAPLDQISLQSPQAQLAARIAGQVSNWISDGEILQSAGRPIRPGDIMILVRTRGAFAEEMVRALKRVGVPVAGRDRMVLTDHIAIMDLMALGRFVLLPEDDLNTATVLKGPLIELDDDDLFDLAFQRAGTLWAALRAKAGGESKYQTAFDKLSVLLAGADYQPPYEFYAGLLGGGGLEALLAHTGAEAREPVDEFLSLALRFEHEHSPSLQGFMQWMDVGETQVKRDLEHGLGEVRVMTVHGAKGLQANVVFLADTCSLPRPQHGPKIHWRDSGSEGEPGIVLWPAFRDNEEALCRELREQAHVEAEREYRRLLYVAMTRARDRLYVAGWGSGDAPPEGCWYDMVSKARDDRWQEIDLGDGLLGHRLPTNQTGTPDSASIELPLEGGGLALPDWAKIRAPDEPTPPQPLAPSRPSGDEPPVRSPMIGDDGARFKRGTLIHRLLQTLPDLEPNMRREAAARFLARPGHDLSPDAQQAIAEETLAVLSDSALQSLFGPNSQAEVPIAGAVGEWVISGQVDRLAISEDVVRVIDFKTNRPPPESESGVASVYLRQMAAYRDLLKQIYPERRVETVLLWTDGPRAMRLSDEILDSAQS